MKDPTSTVIKICSFCDSKKLVQILDLGNVALAGAFLTSSQFPNEKRYPLRVSFCEECLAVQVIDRIPQNILFDDYFYFSSSIATLRNHSYEYAVELREKYLNKPNASVIEFGCNDGILLKPLAELGVKCIIGIDPAKNVVSTISDRRINTINAFFTENVAEHVLNTYGKMDVVVANNVYAHISDIQGVTRAVERVLSEEGVFVFEVHYLGKVLEETQYDMIYHEHIYYYSLLSATNHFKRYGMMVFDVKPISIHAGSIRFYVCKKDSLHAKQSDAVKDMIKDEKSRGYDRCETFEDFSDRLKQHREEIVKLLTKLRRSGKKIAGYGASGRANTIIQYCGITQDHLDYIIDDAPAKQGFYTPGSHFEIRPCSVLLGNDAPDYVLVFAWSFFDEICKKNCEYLARGGKMILPLPNINIFPTD